MTMRLKKVIRRVLDEHRDGVDVVGGVNAVVAVNDGEDGATTSRVSSRQRIVQRDGETVVHEHETTQE